MFKLLKIEGESGIVKDAGNGAVISNDTGAFAAFRLRRARELDAKKKIKNLEKRVVDMENQLNAILKMVEKQS